MALFVFLCPLFLGMWQYNTLNDLQRWKREGKREGMKKKREDEATTAWTAVVKHSLV